MKIKVIERGETEFTASTEWTEPDIRAALATDDKDDNVRSAIMDTTDGERDTDSDEYITITEDDGTVLWSGWLTGDKDKPTPAEARAGDDPVARLLALPLPENDSGASTVRGYLVALLARLVRQGGAFSPAFPFGTAGWQEELWVPMIRAGLVKGRVLDDGDLAHVDSKAADELILAAIERLGQ